MSPTSTLILLLINIPMYIGFGSLLFNGWDEFLKGLKQLYKNRKVFFYSWDEFADSWSEMKVFLYLMSCTCLFFGEYQIFSKWLNG